MINWSTISLNDLASLLSNELRKRGIDSVFLGEASVTIYSENRQQSLDLEYDMKKIRKALKELGLTEKHKYFQHKECPWFIEFAITPASTGNQPIQESNDENIPFGTIKLQSPVDSVKERLANFYHWNDTENLEEAIHICLEQEINIKELESWSTIEKQQEKFQLFKNLLKKINAGVS